MSENVKDFDEMEHAEGVEISDEELDSVAGGRAGGEWVCPDCGYTLMSSHYNINFLKKEHIRQHWDGYEFPDLRKE